MIFNNEILDELSVEGKQYLGSHLQTFLKTLTKERRSDTSVGMSLKITNPIKTLNSLTELARGDLIEKRLNCVLYFCVTLDGAIVEEYEILPQHITKESFALLENTLRFYNMYWQGESMFVNDR